MTPMKPSTAPQVLRCWNSQAIYCTGRKFINNRLWA